MIKIFYLPMIFVLFISCNKTKSSAISFPSTKENAKNEIKIDTTIFPNDLRYVGTVPSVDELSNELKDYEKKNHPYWYLIENDFDNDGKKDRIYLVRGLEENGVGDKYFLIYCRKKRVNYEDYVQIDCFNNPGIIELKGKNVKVNFGDEIINYAFENKSWEKVNIPSNNDISQDKNNAFDGQLKKGEKIIEINWSKEIKVNYTKDMSYDGSRYSSKSFKIPQGKKWILLYINEDLIFDDGTVIGAIPNLFIDNKEQVFYGRRFSNPNNINLSRAKDENFKYYSGSIIQAVSSRTNGKGMANDFIDYKGEIWFLEINE